MMKIINTEEHNDFLKQDNNNNDNNDKNRNKDRDRNKDGYNDEDKQVGQKTEQIVGKQERIQDNELVTKVNNGKNNKLKKWKKMVSAVDVDIETEKKLDKMVDKKVNDALQGHLEKVCQLLQEHCDKKMVVFGQELDSIKQASNLVKEQVMTKFPRIGSYLPGQESQQDSEYLLRIGNILQEWKLSLNKPTSTESPMPVPIAKRNMNYSQFANQNERHLDFNQTNFSKKNEYIKSAHNCNHSNNLVNQHYVDNEYDFEQ